MPLKLTPDTARIYLLLGLLLIAAPSILSLYKGHTGKFLVATGVVSNEPFYETVIYLQNHSIWGAYGVIINKPLAKDADLVSFPESSWNVQIFYGGPVHAPTLLLSGEKSSLNHVLLIGLKLLKEERPDIYNFFEQGKNRKPYRLFTGYSGWNPVQLNLEMAHGKWSVIDYDEELMFNTPAADIWAQAMRRVVEKSPPLPSGV